MRTVKQQGEYDCGIACVAMLLNMTLKESRERCADIFVEDYGIDRKPIVELLEEAGLSVGPTKLGSFKRIEVLDRDALVHVYLGGLREGSHWVVWDASSGRMRDPGDGSASYKYVSYNLIERP